MKDVREKKLIRPSLKLSIKINKGIFNINPISVIGTPQITNMRYKILVLVDLSNIMEEGRIGVPFLNTHESNPLSPLEKILVE